MSIPLYALPESARRDLFRRVAGGAIVSEPLAYASRAERRAWGAGVAGILGVAGLLRGFGDPYHDAMRLDPLGWAMLGLGFGLGLFLFRAWARECHWEGLHGGVAGTFLLPEGVVELRAGRVVFRPIESLLPAWRWETVNDRGELVSERALCLFRDGFEWSIPLDEEDAEAPLVARQQGPEAPRVASMLAQARPGPEPPLPRLARLRPLHGLVGLLLLLPLAWLRDNWSDERAYHRALRTESPWVWGSYAHRTRRHPKEARHREAAAMAALEKRMKEREAR